MPPRGGRWRGQSRVVLVDVRVGGRGCSPFSPVRGGAGGRRRYAQPAAPAAGDGEEGRGTGEGHRPVQASSGPIEPLLYPARRRCVTQRCERACISCRGASTTEGCHGPQGFRRGLEGLANGGRRCVEDIGVSLSRLLLRALRWSLSPLPREDSVASAAPAGALQGRGCGGRRRLPAPACGNCAQGELLLRIMAGAERVLRAAACAEAAAEADRGADAPHRGRAVFGGGRSARGSSAELLRPLRWASSRRALPLCPPGQSRITLPAAAWCWRRPFRSRLRLAAGGPAPFRRAPFLLLHRGAAAPPLSLLSPPRWTGGWRQEGTGGGRERQARSAAAPWRRFPALRFLVAGPVSHVLFLALRCS